MTEHLPPLFIGDIPKLMGIEVVNVYDDNHYLIEMKFNNDEDRDAVYEKMKELGINSW